MGEIPRGLWPPNRGSRGKKAEGLQEVGTWDRPRARGLGDEHGKDDEWGEEWN